MGVVVVVDDRCLILGSQNVRSHKASTPKSQTMKCKFHANNKYDKQEPWFKRQRPQKIPSEVHRAARAYIKM